MTFGFLYLLNTSVLLKTALALISLGVVALVGEYIRSNINNHVRVILNLIESIRSHDFSMRASEAEQRGEVAELYQALNFLADEIKRIREDQLDARRLLEQIIAQINVGVVVLDVHGVIKLANPYSELLLGSRAIEIVGKSVNSTILGSIADREGQWLDHEFEGVQGRWQVFVKSYREKGIPSRIIMVSDLEQILTHVESQAWRRLIRVIAHELNNSLTPIISISQSAKRLIERTTPAKEDDELRQALHVIGMRAENLRRFISDYATFARLPAPQLGEFKIAALMKVVEHTMSSKEVRFVHDERYTYTFIEGDEIQIEQLLINLIKNALESHDSDPDVEVRYKLNRGQCMIEISDRGRGFVNTDDAFVPFYTTKTQGSGIGLALCWQIVTNHFGRIYAENRADGPGAVVTVLLPLRRFINSDEQVEH